ncbi:GNAT family N-acetyltransferase [Pseudarthrobacter sp. J1763]|uniref:GNAT family N-acetyltransferase n=1 Tax=Pseudarthrobacter sp. J1763 TaxID=3420445 RepID=UPI003D2E1D97
MAKTPPRAAPWFPFPRDPARGELFRSGWNPSRLRLLGREDRDELRALALEDPVANVFILTQLDDAVTPWPLSGARIYGTFDAGKLTGACWAGANIVPLNFDPAFAAQLADELAATGRRYASVFGPAGATLAIGGELQARGHLVKEIRDCQPLMTISAETEVTPDPRVRMSHRDDFSVLLPASVAMFEEEVGYSPLTGGDFYSRRVAYLINQGHSMSFISPEGTVVFKAEIGALAASVAQIQGVWLNPTYRGQGLSAAFMAGVVHLARELAPVVSLYVNDYNTRALKTYQRVGFAQQGTFATVLFTVN